MAQQPVVQPDPRAPLRLTGQRIAVVLVLLNEPEQALSVAQIAARAGLPAQTVAAKVGWLHRHGLLSATTATGLPPGPGRRGLYELTLRGLTKIAAAFAAIGLEIPEPAANVLCAAGIGPQVRTHPAASAADQTGHPQ